MTEFPGHAFRRHDHFTVSAGTHRPTQSSAFVGNRKDPPVSRPGHADRCNWSGRYTHSRHVLLLGRCTLAEVPRCCHARLIRLHIFYELNRVVFPFGSCVTSGMIELCRAQCTTACTLPRLSFASIDPNVGRRSGCRCPSTTPFTLPEVAAT